MSGRNARINVPDECMGDRPKQYAIIFVTKFAYVAAPFKYIAEERDDGWHLVVAIIDAPQYTEGEYDRCLDYLFRFFPDYRHKTSWRRHEFNEENWTLKNLFKRYGE